MTGKSVRAAVTALLPLSLCWSGVAYALQTPAAQNMTPSAAPAQQPSQQSLVAGTITPQVFDLPPQSFSLTPRARDYFNTDNMRAIEPRAVPQAPDNGLSIGPFVVREDPTPQAGCRWSFRSNRVRFRCRM